MSGMQNDFIGFTFNGVHSSELGIVRVSEGGRFNENLLPTVQDKTVQIPGGDGTYYYGSYYTQRVFNVSFAFDSMTEVQFRKIRQLFGDKKIHELIFDEAPYKVYQAKVTGSATLKHLCFEEISNGQTSRIYRGEGSVQFTAYNPFARAPKKFLKDYTNPNLEEWGESSGMRYHGRAIENSTNSVSLDVYSSSTKGFFVYNPGDMETDFILTLYFYGNEIPAGRLYFQSGSEELCFNKMSKIGSDVGVQINTKLNLIEGIDSNKKRTGNLYNDCIQAGSFFKIPQTGIGQDVSSTLILYVDLGNNTGQYSPQIEYDYLYF